jgi:hypothetical protein
MIDQTMLVKCPYCKCPYCIKFYIVSYIPFQSLEVMMESLNWCRNRTKDNHDLWIEANPEG